MSDVEVFYGVASGQQRSALSRLEPERVMISHATQNNRPIHGDHELFIDCGGYHHMVSGDGVYDDTDAEYVDYVSDVEPEWFALRDYPCEPDLLGQLGRSVADQQRRTTENHIALYDMVRDAGIDDNAVSVIQGWTTDQYLEHIDTLRDYGLLTERVAIGSVCRRNADEDIATVVRSVRDALPPKFGLHAFGVKGSVLRFKEVVDALDSVDSAAYDYVESRQPNSRSDGESFTWRDCARAYLNWRHDLQERMATESIDGFGYTQSTLGDDRSGSFGSKTLPSDTDRVCVCGTTIPPYGEHREFEPGCRNCSMTALNYWDRGTSGVIEE